MNAAEQLQYEAATRMRYAVVAFLAALLIVGSQLIQLSGVHTNVDELTLDLITAHKRVPIDQISSAVDALGLTALLVMLSWLHHISRARNPQIRSWVRWLVIVGGVLSGTMALAYSIVIAVKASQFIATPSQGYPEANALTSTSIVELVPFIAQFGSLLLAGGVIWTSLNALRVGLLTRPLGYAGVVAGALVLFPLGAFAFIIQAFWLVALSVLFAGRWLNGTPPAWETGTAVPWPQAGRQREAAPPPRPSVGRGRARRSRLSDVEAQLTDPAHPTLSDDVDGAPARTRANTPKRKRKHRG